METNKHTFLITHTRTPTYFYTLPSMSWLIPTPIIHPIIIIITPHCHLYRITKHSIAEVNIEEIYQGLGVLVGTPINTESQELIRRGINWQSITAITFIERI